MTLEYQISSNLMGTQVKPVITHISRLSFVNITLIIPCLNHIEHHKTQLNLQYKMLKCAGIALCSERESLNDCGILVLFGYVKLAIYQFHHHDTPRAELQLNASHEKHQTYLNILTLASMIGFYTAIMQAWESHN